MKCLKFFNFVLTIFIYINICVIFTKCSVLRNKREVSDDLMETMISHIELLEMDYADRCSNLSKARRKTLMGDRDSYDNEYQALLAYGDFARQESIEMRETYSGKSAGDLTTRWIALENNPDALLNREDFSKFIKLQINIQKAKYSLKVPCKEIPCDKLPCETVQNNCVRRRPYLINILRNSRDPAVLKSTYNAAMKPLDQFGADWVSNLRFTENDTKSNWERLSGCSLEDEGWLCGYTLVEELWNEIEPLYLRLIKFVHSRLKKIFRLTESEDVLPIEYLGTLNLREDGFLGAVKNIVPHRQLVDELQAGLDNLNQDELQALSENLVKSLGLNGHHHVIKIIKNCLRCFEPAGELISYCQNSILELLLPNETSPSNVKFDILSFLTRQEQIFSANMLKSLSDSSLESYRLAMENNILFEGLKNLGPTLAIQKLALYGNLVPEEVLMDPNNENTALLILALKILPKLAYYRNVDKFRLEILENEKTPNDITSKWQEVKMKELKVSDQNSGYDFLVDSKVVENRPFLSKFLGTILHFELLQNTKSQNFPENFKKISRESIWPASAWQHALKNHFGIERITTDALLDYFRPLNDYFDETEDLKQVITPLFPRTTTTTTQKVPITTKGPYEDTKNVTDSEPSKTVEKSSVKVGGDSPKKPLGVGVGSKEMKKPNETSDKESESDKESNLKNSHIGAIIGALIGLFVATIITAMILKKKYQNRRRVPKNNRNGNR